MTTAFVTVDEYELLTGTTITDPTVEERVQFLLDAACDEIRNHCNQTLDYVADDVVLLNGTGRKLLLVPEVPIVEVTSLMVGDEIITDFVVFTDSGMLWRDAGWVDGVANIILQYSHGFVADAFPKDLKKVAVQVTRADLTVSPGGIVSESIMGYSYSRGEVKTGIQEYAGVLDKYVQHRVPASRAAVIS